MRKATTKAEKLHMAKVSLLPCAVAAKAALINDGCAGRVEVHHLTKCGRRLGNYFTIPLCGKHHQHGKISIGKGWKTFEEHYGTQAELLEETCLKLKVKLPEKESKIKPRSYYVS